MLFVTAGGSEYGGGGGGEENVPLLPCLVFVHGESYQWNSGNPYDGSVLAHHGQLIVVTLNFRLGILGEFALFSLPWGVRYNIKEKRIL